ncbi:MAG: septum site-determining protein MinC [Gammaproteobacteria bacterium]|nr:septum site-determining protein MinC [Gammaproteobacteria bacterium]
MNRPRPALELKGRMLPVTRLRVLRDEAEAIRAQLQALAQQMPQAVAGMPVVIDADAATDLRALLAAVREVGMQPLAVGEGPLAQMARILRVAVVSADTGKPAAERPPAAGAGRAVKPDLPPASRVGTRIVTQPVRSGQQIYAEGGDLVVLAAVSAGAEVIADGCIHVYGRLAGRALAGARGDETARVFCRKLDAELIAIAGIYAVSEQINDGPRGVSAQAYLQDGRLMIELHQV